MHIYKKKKRRKWDQKGRKGIFIGYSEETKGYRICFNGREISLSRDVIFKKEYYLPIATEVKIIKEEEINSKNAAESEEDNNDEEEKLDDDEQIPVEVEEQKQMILRDREKLNKPIRYTDAFFFSL
jgi:hypothetical protein